MKSFFSIFRESAKELKKPTTIPVTGMLIALYIVLKAFATVPITTDLRITFAFLALASIGMLYGPTIAFFSGIIGDVLGFFVTPSTGAFFPGYTVAYAVEAMIYGLILYHKINNKYSVSITNAEARKTHDITYILKFIVSRCLAILICYIGINTINRYLTMGAVVAFSWPSLSARIIKNSLQLPIDIIIMSISLPSILAAYKRVFKKSSAKA